MWIADSYAKINLGLNILERLPTGYHQVETGLCFLQWHDRFEIQQAEKMKVEINGKNETEDSINRAIAVLDKYVSLKHNYYFNVEKRIPSGAGLGDDSSNATITLRMLNKIEELGLSDSDLIDLGRNLGTNIPFFIKGETGIGRGMGHEFEEVSIQPDLWIITCFPNETSNGAGAYSLTESNPDSNFSIKKILAEEEPDEWRYMLFNDFEQTVIQQIPVAGNLKDQFYEFGAVYASLTGSGPAVYGLFEQEFVAVSAYKTLLELGYPANLTPPDFTPDYGIYRKE